MLLVAEADKGFNHPRRVGSKSEGCSVMLEKSSSDFQRYLQCNERPVLYMDRTAVTLTFMVLISLVLRHFVPHFAPGNEI